jgi:hypothetical protein
LRRIQAGMTICPLELIRRVALDIKVRYHFLLFLARDPRDRDADRGQEFG